MGAHIISVVVVHAVVDVVMVASQNLKTRHQAFEFGPIPWLDVPAAAHHLGNIKIDLCM